MVTERMKHAAEMMESAINVMGNQESTEYFVREMCNMHRTLQQIYTGDIVIPFVRVMAKRYKGGFYDARNEFACKMCSVMWDALVKEFGITDDSIRVGLPMI